MEIRRLTFEHAARCAELEELLFPGENPWTRDIFVVEFAQPNHLYLGVFDDDELLAYGGIAQLGPREDPEFVSKVTIARSWRLRVRIASAES